MAKCRNVVENVLPMAVGLELGSLLRSLPTQTYDPVILLEELKTFSLF